MSISTPRFLTLAALTAAGLAAAAPPASAQGYGSYAPRSEVFQGHVMLGYSLTSGTTADFLEDGGLIDGGFSFFPEGGPVGLRVDLSYGYHNATSQLLQYGEQSTGYAVDNGYGEIGAVSVGAVVRAAWSSHSHVYALAQIGESDVRVQLNQSNNGSGSYCNPFYCGSDYNGRDSTTVYDRSIDRFSWNLGVGVEFPLRGGQNLFLEAQYRRIETPTPLEYWPLAVGWRF